MTDSLAIDGYPLHKIALFNEMEKLSINVRKNTKCTLVQTTGVTVINQNNQEEFIPADTIIYSVGMKPEEEVAEKLINAVNDNIPVYKIGDCVRPAKVFEAVREGFEAGITII